MNRRSALLLFAAALPLGGCLQSRQPAATGSLRSRAPAAPPRDPVATGTVRGPAPTPAVREPATTGALYDPGMRDGYTLATGDKLRIIVFGQDSLSNLYSVDGSGRITMPLIGSVPVAGMTTLAATAAIETKLRGGFVREPKVTVEIDTYRPFFILGEVTTSGQFAFVNGATVETAVAIAGGYTPRAQRSYADLTRRGANGIVTREVPITYPIRPGDTIVIKERWF